MFCTSSPPSKDKDPIKERVKEIEELLKNPSDSSNFESKFKELFYGNEQSNTPSVEKLVLDSVKQREKTGKKLLDNNERLKKNSFKSLSSFEIIKILNSLKTTLKTFIGKKPQISEALNFEEVQGTIGKISVDYIIEMNKFYDTKIDPFSIALIRQSMNSTPLEDNRSSEGTPVSKSEPLSNENENKPRKYLIGERYNYS